MTTTPQDARLIAWLLALPPGTDPSAVGALCAAWYDSTPGPFGCEHPTCYALAYRDAPPHSCAVEADQADPISQHYGMFLASCHVCDLWEQRSEQAATARQLGEPPHHAGRAGRPHRLGR